MPAYPMRRSRLMAKTPQIRISWRSLTGYVPAKSGKAATIATSAAKPTSRAVVIFRPPRRLRKASGARRSGECRAWSFQSPSEQALRAEEEDQGHHDVDHQHRRAREPHLPEGFGLADDEAAHQRPLEAAEAADDDDDERGNEDRGAHRGRGRLDGAGDHTREGREPGASGEDAL